MEMEEASRMDTLIGDSYSFRSEVSELGDADGADSRTETNFSPLCAFSSSETSYILFIGSLTMTCQSAMQMQMRPSFQAMTLCSRYTLSTWLLQVLDSISRISLLWARSRCSWRNQRAFWRPSSSMSILLQRMNISGSHP